MDVIVLLCIMLTEPMIQESGRMFSRVLRFAGPVGDQKQQALCLGESTNSATYFSSYCKVTAKRDPSSHNDFSMVQREGVMGKRGRPGKQLNVFAWEK